ncbi:3-isopropylmalate dehydratase [Pseudomonas aeruginosa]|nr:3-isopropylmalate dehydratase [Pseudomonas aeruginosa]
MRPMYAVAILFLLAGCSSVPAEKTRAIPAERLLGYQQPVSSGGRLEVHRDYGYLGGGCYVAFLIDRQVAARIGVGEEASFPVPAGEHVVGIGIDTQDGTLCGKGLLNRELRTRIAADGNARFRIVSEASSGFDIRAE